MFTSDRSYEVLGVQPGVSRQELKTAYRDLTKVWHPDRFTHDPSLQKKAQEKLAEINDAYEQLSSGKARRHRMAKERAANRVVVPDYNERWNARSPVVVRRSTSSVRILIPIILFSAVFVLTVRFLHTKANREARAAIEQVAVDTATDDTPNQVANDALPARVSNETSSSNTRVGEQPSVPTITVVIDSTTGLLARSECPTRIRMTYPSGNEPRAYCNLHPANSASNPNHQSKLKSLKKTDSSTDESDK